MMTKFTSFDDIASFIANENAKLTANFKQALDDFTLQIKNMNDHFNTKLDSLKLENNDLNNRILSLEDHVARMDRRNQLIIRGIPVLKDENLYAVLSSISSTINFDINKCSGINIFRVTVNIKKSSHVEEKRTLRSTSVLSQIKIKHSPAVVINFGTSYDRNSFFRQYLHYLKNGSLNVAQLGIGLSSSARIYVSENLTKKNSFILMKCAALKHIKKIYQYFTKNGLVYLRRSKDDSPVLISEVGLLSQLFPAHILGSTSS